MESHFGVSWAPNSTKKHTKLTLQKTRILGAATKCLLGSYATFRAGPGCQATTARWSLLEMKTEGGKTKGTTFMTRRWTRNLHIWKSIPKLIISSSFKGGFIEIYVPHDDPFQFRPKRMQLEIVVRSLSERAFLWQWSVARNAKQSPHYSLVNGRAASLVT